MLSELADRIEGLVGSPPVVRCEEGNTLTMEWAAVCGRSTVILNAGRPERLQIQITTAGGFFALSMEQERAGSSVFQDAVMLLRENL